MTIKREAALPLPKRPLHLRAAALATGVACCLAWAPSCFGRTEDGGSPAPAPQVWSCKYIATTPKGPLQITAKFQVMGDELAEIETIPEGLNFSEKYKILENNETDIVAAISITRLGDPPPPGIGALVVIIAKQNGLFQQSGSLLGLRTGPPTLGHCENQ